MIHEPAWEAEGESADGDASRSGHLFLFMSNYVRDNSDTPCTILGNQNSQGHRIPGVDMEGSWKGDRMIF